MPLSVDSTSIYSLHNRPAPSLRQTNSHRLAWTSTDERRLSIVQAQLAKAQAEWSEDQEIWLDEVHELEERKRKYKKAVKRESRRAGKRTSLWRTSSSRSANSAGATSEEDGDDEGEEEEAQALNTRRPSLGFSIRGMSGSKRRSTFSGGGASDIRQSQTTPSTPKFGKIFRWWSSKGDKGKTNATSTSISSAGLAEPKVKPLRGQRRETS